MSWRPSQSSVSTSPPSVAIELSLGAAPRVITGARTEDEAQRLTDWFLANADLIALIEQAVRIREEWERRDAA